MIVRRVHAVKLIMHVSYPSPYPDVYPNVSLEADGEDEDSDLTSDEKDRLLSGLEELVRPLYTCSFRTTMNNQIPNFDRETRILEWR
jgi:hypothetical protein